MWTRSEQMSQKPSAEQINLLCRICGREANKYRRSPKKSAPDSKTAHMNKKVKYRIETVMMPGTRGRTFALLLKNR